MIRTINQSLVLVFVAWIAWPVFVFGQDDGRLAIDFGTAVKSSIVLPGSVSPRVVFPSSPSPFVAVDNVVYDITAEKAVGTAFLTLAPVALSEDGKYFAYNGKEIRRPGHIIVMDVATGATLYEFEVFPGVPNQAVHRIVFTKSNQLYAFATAVNKSSLFQWNVDDGKLVQEMRGGGLGSFSSDGRFMAIASRTNIIVVDVAKGRAVRSLAEPTLPGIDWDPRNVYSLAFSPDSSLLAAGVHGFGIVVWNDLGKVVEQYRIFDSIPAQSPEIRWLPDSSGWLFGGPCILLRRIGRVVWKSNPRRNDAAILDQDHVIVVTSNSTERQLVTVNWQRPRILQTIDLVEKGDVALRPDDSIGMNIAVGNLRGGQSAEVINTLGETVATRYAQRGVRIAKDQDVVLRIRYDESAGGTTTVGDVAQEKDAYEIYWEINGGAFGYNKEAFERYKKLGLVKVQWPIIEIQGGLVPPPPGARKRSSAETTMIRAEFRLMKRGTDRPLWYYQAPYRHGYRDEGKDLTEKFLRDAAVNGLITHLKLLDYPYAIPKMQKLPSLPIIWTSELSWLRRG